MLRTLSLRPPPPTGPATRETQSLGPHPVSVPALCSSSRPSIPQFSSLQIPQIPPLAHSHCNTDGQLPVGTCCGTRSAHIVPLNPPATCWATQSPRSPALQHVLLHTPRRRDPDTLTRPLLGAASAVSNLEGRVSVSLKDKERACLLPAMKPQAPQAHSLSWDTNVRHPPGPMESPPRDLG